MGKHEYLVPKTPKRVLVVLPTERDHSANVVSNLDPEEFQMFWFEDPDFICSTNPNPEFNLVRYVEKCTEFILKNRIEAIIYSHDMASLVAAVLCERHGLIGPSLESMFLCQHKYYFRKKEKKSILIDIIDVENGTKNLENLTYPVYIKPPCLMFSRFQYRINSQQELTDAIETVRPQLSNWNKTFHDFFRQYVDLDKYPLADKNIMLVEELVLNASHHCVEGWVEPDGSIHIWALSDQNYFTDGRMTLDNYSTPSYLSQALQEKIISESIDIVKNIGIKSGFWNLEIWIQGDRYLFTEVNSRCVSFFYNLYSGTYQTSLYQAIIHLACGNVAACRALAPKAPENSGWVRFGAQFHVVTYGEGNVEDFIDYHFLDSISETKVTVFPDKGQYITQTSSAGYVLAQFELFGNSHEEINERALYLRSKMLKKPECSPDAIYMVGEKLAPSTRAASWVPGSPMDCADP